MEAFNEDIMTVNEQGIPVPVTGLLSTTIDVVLEGLGYLRSIAKRWWLKFAISIVITAIQSFKQQYPKQAK